MSLTYCLNFKLSGLPKMLNGSHGHWRAVAAQKKRWRNLSRATAIASGRPPQALKRAILILTRHSARQPDFENLAASFKAIVDGLIDAGIIEDDSPDHVEREYRWQKTSPKNGHVTVEVREQK